MPTTTRTVPLATLFGIRIGVNPSWFLALLLMIALLGNRFAVVLPAASDAAAYALAVGAAALFFLSLVSHELGHALAARRFGIQTEGIDLWLLGGVARLSRDSRTPKEEFVVAAAGPFVTFVIVAITVGIGLLLGSPGDVWDAALVTGDEQTTTAGLAIVGWVAFLNAALLLFNLVPAFPLDGGRIARSIAWAVTGDRRRATAVAAMLGRAGAIVLAAAGVFELLQGDPFGLWYGFIAWFMWGAAQVAVASSDLSEQLHEVTAAAIMDPQPSWLPTDATVLQAEHDTFRPFDVPWAAMLDDDGRYLGIVTADRVREELSAGRPNVPARELLDADDAPRVPPDAALEDLLQSETMRRLGALPVVDAEGFMRGLVTFAQVRAALVEALPGVDVRT